MTSASDAYEVIDQTLGVIGDGGFTMLMGELITAVAYNLPIKLVIIKNNTLGQIKWEQMIFLGNPEYGVELEPIECAGPHPEPRHVADFSMKTPV